MYCETFFVLFSYFYGTIRENISIYYNKEISITTGIKLLWNVIFERTTI